MENKNGSLGLSQSILKELSKMHKPSFSGFCMPVIKEVNFEQKFDNILQQKQKINFER